MIRVLIVEDSPTSRQLLTEILSSDPEIQVIGSAADGAEGVQRTLDLRPDLVTMDIRMPRLDGFEATRRIMEQCPTPILVVSASAEPADSSITFNAIQAGALEVFEKPIGPSDPQFAAQCQRLITAVKLMAGIKLVRRRVRPPTRPLTPLAPAAAPARNLALLAIGASTGGPMALATLLKALPADFPLPILVVQHIASGFVAGLVSWLQTNSRLPLTLAADGEIIAAGQVYFAPEGRHLIVPSRGILGTSQAPPVSHVRPSATVLFNSVARVYRNEAGGVLLTGMGDDGAMGLKAIHDAGGPTFAQDEASSVVYGMPKAAVDLGAATYVLPVDRIAPALLRLLQASR
jgi:two-component system, chemotaxis family, protein-glutamate methylesterase/glutaminase